MGGAPYSFFPPHIHTRRLAGQIIFRHSCRPIAISFIFPAHVPHSETKYVIIGKYVFLTESDNISCPSQVFFFNKCIKKKNYKLQPIPSLPTDPGVAGRRSLLQKAELGPSSAIYRLHSGILQPRRTCRPYATPPAGGSTIGAVRKPPVHPPPLTPSCIVVTSAAGRIFQYKEPRIFL